MLRKLRMKLADILIGDQIVMFAPQRYIDMLGGGDYLAMPDNLLATATRRWFAAIAQVAEKKAGKLDSPLSVMVTQQACLSLAQYARDANAETLTITVHGTIDGGKSEGVYRVEYTKLPDDYDMGPLGVQTETCPDDPSKIVKLQIGIAYGGVS